MWELLLLDLCFTHLGIFLILALLELPLAECIGRLDDVHEYLATRTDPWSMRQFCPSSGDSKKVMSMDISDSMTDVFEGSVQFMYVTYVGEHLRCHMPLSCSAECQPIQLGVL